MKKTLFILFLFLTIGVKPLFSQTDKEFNFGFGMSYGTANTGTFEFIIDYLNTGNKFNNGIGFTLGLSFPIEYSTLGDSYDGIIYKDQYPEDIYEEGLKRDYGFYLTPSYHFNRFVIGVRLGASSVSSYQNGFNTFMGLYYVTYDQKESFLYGGSLEGRITKHWSLALGYDNFNDGTIGVNIRF